MLQNKINGILGVWVFLLAFLGFSETMHRFLLVLTGVAIAVIGLGGKYIFKSTKEIIKETQKAEKELEQEKQPFQNNQQN